MKRVRITINTRIDPLTDAGLEQVAKDLHSRDHRLSLKRSKGRAIDWLAFNYFANKPINNNK